MNINIPQDANYTETLVNLGIGNTLVNHPHLTTPPEVLQHLELELSDGISTMLMKTDDHFVLIVRRDDCRFDSKKIKAITSSKNVRMATREEFVELTHLPIGAAQVYIPNFPTYIDEKVLEKEYVIGGSGSFTHSIRYKTADLPNIPGSRIVDVSKEELF
ncbi:MAG: YbaK/EbsC family protein [bacterium]|nr:YbaK/EbsC family protein [bacterium]